MFLLWQGPLEENEFWMPTVKQLLQLVGSTMLDISFTFLVKQAWTGLQPLLHIVPV